MLNYLSDKIPNTYYCHFCKKTNCKLWREYNTFLNNLSLYCYDCIKIKRKTEGVDYLWGNSDQLGGLVPAIPTEDETTYWGYTSVPLNGVRWWHLLEPTLSAECFKKYLVSDTEWKTYTQKIEDEEKERVAKLPKPKRLEDCKCIIEIEGDDELNLWSKYSKQSEDFPKYIKYNWEQISMGFWKEIGKVDGRPICVSVSFYIIEGHLFGFVEGTSELVDYKMIKEWIKEKNPTAYITDAMNFHNALLHIKRG